MINNIEIERFKQFEKEHYAFIERERLEHKNELIQLIISLKKLCNECECEITKKRNSRIYKRI